MLPSRRNEVVEHWCLEPACQSDPDTATNSQIVAPGPRGARRVDCFYFRCPPARTSPVGGLYGRLVSPLRRPRCPSSQRHRLCPDRRTRWQTDQARAHLLHHDARPARASRLAVGPGGDPRGYGVDRGLLETRLPHPGRPVHRVAGQRPPHQASPRPQDRRQGL